YYLHLKYHGSGLKTETFFNICNLVLELYSNQFHDEADCNELMNQLCRYKAKESPFDFPYDIHLTPKL
ncbi:1668_t:CDS:1, partial [Cetraspora pellucida]